MKALFFSCSIGSDLYGNATIVCLHDGTWTGLPKCLKRCDIPSIKNSNIKHNSTSYANMGNVSVICNENAKLLGNSVITCQNGTWSNLPNCNVYRCFNPTAVPHGAIEALPEYPINKAYSVGCDTGYNGIVSAYCQTDGQWNITGACGVQRCSRVPSISSSIQNYNSTRKYTWNDTFTYR